MNPVGACNFGGQNARATRGIPEFYFLEPRNGFAAPAAPERESVPTLSVFDVEALRRDFPAQGAKAS
jgi:hypothetical protein